MSRVALVRPALVSSAGSYSNPLTPPIGLAYLAGALRRDGVEAVCIDAIGEAPLKFIEDGAYLYQGLTEEDCVERIPDDVSLIGVTCMFTQDWPYTRRVIETIRRKFPKTPIIVGGEHITALPEFTLRDCPQLDACALGEGEETIAEYAKCLAGDGDLTTVAGLLLRAGGKRTPPRKRIRAVDDIEPPAWDLVPIETYLSTRNAHGVFRGRSMPILGTRGCPYECTFCSNPVMYGRSWFARDPDKVLDEIEGYVRDYKADNVDFYDLTMIVKRDWILNFCKAIEKRGLKFTWQLPSGTRSEVIDDEVADAIHRNGCRNLTYAPESGSNDTLVKIKKKVRLDRLVKSARSALRRGINVKCNLIVGFPHETRKHLWQTLKFSWKMAVIGVHDVPFYLFSPYPGSELFDEIERDHFPNGLNDGYFRSLVAFMDLTESSHFCKGVGARELNAWRIFGMASFYSLSFLIRPWRFIRLIVNVLRNVSETVLEQRLGAIFRRPKPVETNSDESNP